LSIVLSGSSRCGAGLRIDKTPTFSAHAHDPVKNKTLQAKVSSRHARQQHEEELDMTGNMSGKRAWVALAAVAALGILATTSASATDHDRNNGRERGGSVVPCSLDGVNPAHHPDIFGNAAAAQSYGFVRGPNGTWHVRADCRR
jgi:hypothetical protein